MNIRGGYQNINHATTTAIAAAAVGRLVDPPEPTTSCFGGGGGGGFGGGGGAFGKTTDTVSFAVATFAFIVDGSANRSSVASALDDPPPPPPPAFATAVLTSEPCITADTAVADAIIASGVDAASMSVFSTVADADESLATAAVAAELGAFAEATVPAATAF